MTREEVIRVLRAHEGSLRQRGVTSVALFGSVARGEANSESDLDIMVDISPAARVDLYDYVGITHYIAGLFPISVDVADREMLNAPVRITAERDAIYAF